MDAFMKTDVGMKRANNQDFVFKTTHPIGSLPNLFILADGMGGYVGGDIASKNTVRVVTQVVENSKKEDPYIILKEAVEAANDAIFEVALTDESLKNMGTTLVVATIIDNNLIVANIGDSRLYTIDDDIVQITEDHSYVAEMVRLGALTKEEADKSEDKNVITRAIGVEKDVRADMFNIPLNKNTKVLMCSDGLYNMVKNEKIKSIVDESQDGLEAVKKLVEAANTNGGADNVSVILITL